jgi:two-component system response regulator AtoC
VLHVLLLDLPHGDEDSLHSLRWLRRLRPELPIILLSRGEDGVRAKEAIRLGAKEFLVQPFAEEQLESAIRRQLAPPGQNNQTSLASEGIEQLGDGAFFMGASPVMQKLRAQAELLAQASVPILIVGEPGSGRNTTAQLIHKLSLRSEFAFVRVNCAALPGDLLEKELFGHVGSSSGVDNGSTLGKFEMCDKATIFLAEIASMPVGLQEKLLHVMQTKQFVRPGTHDTVDVDVRVLAATDVNVDRALSEKTLREDLYCRLSAFTVYVPPLRQRKEEIPLLLQHLMHKLARRYCLAPRQPSPTVLDACQRHSWPGNVRDLENFAKRYLVIGDQDLILGRPGPGDSVKGDHFPQIQDFTPGTKPNWQSNDPTLGNKSLKSLLKELKCEAERNLITAALDKTGWNRKAAAHLLKISYRNMLYKIDQYEVQFPETYSSSLGPRM